MMTASLVRRTNWKTESGSSKSGTLLRRRTAIVSRSVGASVLKRGHHERVDQFLEDNLAGYGLGHFDDCCQVQMFSRRADCGRGRGRISFLVQVRVAFVELLHLAERA